MAVDQEGAKVAGDEQVQTNGKAKPTPLTLVVHSTPLYANDVLTYRALDGLLARYHVVRVIAEEGSAVSRYAALWCKQQKVKLVWVIKDANWAERDDRARRWAQIAAEKPHLALFFNAADRWLEAARTLHGAGIPVILVRPSEQNAPIHVSWAPGMTDSVAVPDMRTVARNVRRGRPRKKLSEAEAKRRQDEAKAVWRERQRLKKLAADPRPLAFGGAPEAARQASEDDNGVIG